MKLFLLFLLVVSCRAAVYLTTPLLTVYGTQEARLVTQGDFLISGGFITRVKSVETAYGTGWFRRYKGCLFTEGSVVNGREVNGTRIWRAGWVDISTVRGGYTVRCEQEVEVG